MRACGGRGSSGPFARAPIETVMIHSQAMVPYPTIGDPHLDAWSQLERKLASVPSA